MSTNTTHLFDKLLEAETDLEITNIIKKDHVLSNPNNWEPYGGIENKNNLGTINNQQQNPVAALCEKLLNSIDALLIKECYLKGIIPESKDAPNTMMKAVELFFGVPNGDFSEVMESKRRALAKNIIVLASGLTNKPSISILDTGEGQNYDGFKDTFLSLHKDNKVKIKFVQGKFNMGSTGVLRFCGDNHYQLILSRKHPKLLKNNQKDEWGFTIVRLRPEVSEEEKHSWYEYCVDENGEIFHFDAPTLKLFNDIDPVHFGSFVKMYEYQLQPGTRSNITLDLWRELNRFLYYPALPMLLYDLRYTRGHATSGKVLLGNKTRVLVDEKDKIEHSSIIKDVSFGEAGLLNIEYAVFKADAVRTRDVFTSEKEAIFFTVNGQTHAALPRGFIKNQVRLPYIAQSLLVQVDCTSVPAAVRDKIFMGSRDRMADHSAAEKLQEILAAELREDEGLQTINKLRHEKILSYNPKETKFMEEVVSELIKGDRDLINLLGLTGKVIDVKDPGTLHVAKFEGKKFPTYFRLANGGGVKKIPSNSYVRVKFETDAANDYFYRDKDPGDLIFEPTISTSKHLYNGVLTTKLISRPNAVPGTRETVLVELIRPYDKSLREAVEVEYTGRIEPRVNPPGPEPEPKGKNYGLPKYNLIPREKWNELGWAGEDIAEVVPIDTNQGAGESNSGIEVNISEDPDILRHFLRTKELSEEKADIIKKRYITSIFLYSLVVHNHFSKLYKKDLVPEVMKSISKIILNLLFSEKFLRELEKI
ncbi:hypothetical protein HYW40_00835 [Candidatus Curtissbacteria bacterium]|nr:hypothetical protein [Candidatus Curtissbacteria bacterium]